MAYLHVSIYKLAHRKLLPLFPSSLPTYVLISITRELLFVQFVFITINASGAMVTTQYLNARLYYPTLSLKLGSATSDLTTSQFRSYFEPLIIFSCSMSLNLCWYPICNPVYSEEKTVLGIVHFNINGVGAKVYIITFPLQRLLKRYNLIFKSS